MAEQRSHTVGASIGTGRCEFTDPAENDRCVNRGIALTLRDQLGHYARRVLCGLHSDWVQAPQSDDLRLGEKP